jgi:hypothetical protein
VPFEVVALPPTPTALSLGGAGSDTLSVSWSASPGGPWRHQIQLAHDGSFARLLDDRPLAEPTFTRPMPAPGSYHIRVRQIDADGLAGAWGEPKRLEVPDRIVTSNTQPLTSTGGQPVLRGLR